MHNVTDFAPTSASARDAHAAGELAAWSQAFLRGEGGNVGVLAEVLLGDIYAISGADPEFEQPVSLDG